MWEPFSAIQHLKKLIRLFYNNHPKKPIVTSPSINSALLMVRLTIKPTKPTIKQKQSQPVYSINKKAKNWACTVTNSRLNWLGAFSFSLYRILALNVLFKSHLESITFYLGMKLPWPSYKTSLFFLKSSYKVKRFFIKVTLFNNYPHLRFFLFSYPLD